MDHIMFLALAAMVAMTIGVTASVYTAPVMNPVTSQETELVGGWTQPASPAITKEAQAAFDEAMEGFTGVGYKPVELLGTQVVAGTNYRFLCDAQVVYPGAEPYQAMVTIYEDLDGNASILDITDLKG